jgi:penicillin V acylase-like amidase (Ntn superfamily)
MCTAATYKTKDFYFGRTLDYEFSYGDEVTVTPRNYPFQFRYMGEKSSHYAIIGMAHVVGDYPLYYDGINEKGVGMAGLNFVGNAVYQEVSDDRENVAQYEFIGKTAGKSFFGETSVKDLRRENMRSRFTPPAVMQTEGSIITRPTTTIRSRRWTCTTKIWTEAVFPVIRL